MKTAKQVWEGYRVAYEKRFANRSKITIDEVNNFKEEFLQSALDKAWEAGMREAARIGNQAVSGNIAVPQDSVKRAILARVKERNKT